MRHWEEKLLNRMLLEVIFGSSSSFHRSISIKEEGMLSQLSINALIDLVTGDSELTPRQTGPQLISWFNPFGFQDNYSNGLPPDNVSRKVYAYSRVQRINEEFDIKSFLESIVDSRRFVKNPELKIEPAAEFINKVIAFDRLTLKKIGGVYKLFDIDGNGEVGVLAVFDNIQQVIIKEIEQAEFMIWVAVAWFTDKRIFQALEIKKRSGLDVKVIIIDDGINNGSGIAYESGFNTKRVQPTGRYENIMHHKFAIFDLKKVIHGSYNWTIKAQYNNESVSVTQSRTFAEDFARRFVALSVE